MGQKSNIDIYCKDDIMSLFKCRSDKALKILRTMFSMKKAIKIGKEYYTTQDDLVSFLVEMQGEEILI